MLFASHHLYGALLVAKPAINHPHYTMVLALYHDVATISWCDKAMQRPLGLLSGMLYSVGSRHLEVSQINFKTAACNQMLMVESAGLTLDISHEEGSISKLPTRCLILTIFDRHHVLV